MTNNDAIKILTELLTYCSATSLDAVNYTIAVLEKLEEQGVSEPLNTDFTKLNK